MAAGVAALIAGLGFDALLPAEDGLVQLALNCLAVGGVYVGVLLALGLSEDDRQVVNAVIRRLRPQRGKVGNP